MGEKQNPLQRACGVLLCCQFLAAKMEIPVEWGIAELMFRPPGTTKPQAAGPVQKLFVSGRELDEDATKNLAAAGVRGCRIVRSRTAKMSNNSGGYECFGSSEATA